MKAFIAYTGQSVRAFEMSCGLSNGYVNSIKDGASSKIIGQIVARYPELNTVWLISGEGDMTLRHTDSAEDLRRSLAEARATIETLREVNKQQSAVIELMLRKEADRGEL